MVSITQTMAYETIAHLNRHVHDVHVELYPLHFKPYQYEAVRDFFQSVIDKPQFIFLLLEDEGQPIGYAWIELKQYKESAFMKSYRSVFIHQISISNGHRNKGYGSIMMEYIEHLAQKNEIGIMELDYWANNVFAAKFYEKNGFTVYRQFVYKNVATSYHSP
ncbi:GNAT family N-acetyltransferase [Paenibacillus sp. UNC451MF]|uniref:GNAT family N-acetyltransferase n=1 Tax=Paenibacillus sp. UNC451MF TaxID=1449063 RepID=UPI00048D1CA7|nr:GNAT family N-acetyltransferase [Paenibacillus sp. UNC451MF]